MRPVEIDRDNFGGIGREIRKNIAAARGDRDYAIGGLKVQRLHVDDRIFPDLRIDEVAKREGEHPLLQTAPRKGPMPVNSRLEAAARHALKRPMDSGHGLFSPQNSMGSPNK